MTPDRRAVDKILAAKEQILGLVAPKPKKRKAAASVDDRESMRSADNAGVKSHGHKFSVESMSPELIATIIEAYRDFALGSIPLLDPSILNADFGLRCSEMVFNVVMATGGFCLMDVVSSDQQIPRDSSELDAEEALLSLRGGSLPPSPANTTSLGPFAPQSPQEWTEFASSCMNRATELIRNAMIPIPVSTPSSPADIIIGLIHSVFAAVFLHNDLKMGERFFRMAVALAPELDPVPRTRDGELARRLLWAMYGYDRSGVMQATHHAWMFPEHLISGVALPGNYSTVEVDAPITLDMIQTPEQLTAIFPLLNGYAIKALLFDLRSRIGRWQAANAGPTSLMNLLLASDPGVLLVRELLDAIIANLTAAQDADGSPASLTSDSKAAEGRFTFVKLHHLLMLANTIKVILYSPPTVRDILMDESGWVSSSSFVTAFEATSGVCDSLETLCATPGELDRLPFVLWPCMVKVSLLFVALIRRLKRAEGEGETDLTKMLRTKLAVHIRTLEYVATCAPALGSLAQVMRALVSPVSVGSAEQSQLMDEVLAMFPMGKEGSFLV
ncbi:hypothetical protein DFJ74DRAFT_688716 [Hyaloraphidium curvatum]|nr:hypothetical protein DFJ74DRAFT_688716 [Hyaloraphidium curvatum]